MPKVIHKIEATTTPQLIQRKRVAAYARISVSTEMLLHSLDAQISYYSELIQNTPGWVYAGVYADEGVTGTKLGVRDSFQRMLTDCEAGKIDIILTKSLSRFARNTVDTLQTIRHLRDLGIEVRFEKEGINTLDDSGELLITLYASFAQEESRSISENVKWGIRKRFEQGIPRVSCCAYGYRWEGDQLVIIPEEAAVVRRIYQDFVDGISRSETAKALDAEGIRTRKGNRFGDPSLKTILTNVTYTGNMLLQKKYVEGVAEKKEKRNHGELPQYFIENTHEAIIDQETFDYVQAEMARRKALGFRANKSLNLTCFSSIIKCGVHGCSFARDLRVSKDGKYRRKYWCCSSTRRKGGRCTKGRIPEPVLRQVCAQALGVETFDEQLFLARVKRITVSGKRHLLFEFRDGSTWETDWIPTRQQSIQG